MLGYFALYSERRFVLLTMHGFYGQTLGKMALGIKVLDVSESPISMQQAFLRDSVYIVFNVITQIIWICLTLGGDPIYLETVNTTETIIGTATRIWFLAEILSCLTNKKRRAVHDFIAGTVVVKTTNAPVEVSES